MRHTETYIRIHIIFCETRDIQKIYKDRDIQSLGFKF